MISEEMLKLNKCCLMCRDVVWNVGRYNIQLFCGNYIVEQIYVGFFFT